MVDQVQKEYHWNDHLWLGKELCSDWDSRRAGDWWGLVKEVQMASE